MLEELTLPSRAANRNYPCQKLFPSEKWLAIVHLKWVNHSGQYCLYLIFYVYFVCFRLVLEKHHQQNMAAKHISIDTWLEALGMMDYLPLFSNFAGVEVRRLNTVLLKYTKWGFFVSPLDLHQYPCMCHRSIQKGCSG